MIKAVFIAATLAWRPGYVRFIAATVAGDEHEVTKKSPITLSRDGDLSAATTLRLRTGNERPLSFLRAEDRLGVTREVMSPQRERTMTFAHDNFYCTGERSHALA